MVDGGWWVDHGEKLGQQDKGRLLQAPETSLPRTSVDHGLWKGLMYHVWGSAFVQQMSPLGMTGVSGELLHHHLASGGHCREHLSKEM